MSKNLRYIYKFYSANNEYNFKAVENNQVYLTYYKKFNDPLEFLYETEEYYAAEKIVLKYIKNKKLITPKGSGQSLSLDEYNMLSKQVSRYGLNYSLNNSFNDIFDVKNDSFKHKIYRIKQKFYSSIEKRIRLEINRFKGVCCFTNLDKLSNFKMWDFWQLFDKNIIKM